MFVVQTTSIVRNAPSFIPTASPQSAPTKESDAGKGRWPDACWTDEMVDIYHRLRANDPTLTQLELYRFGDVEAEAVGWCLKTNTCLRVLEIGFNHIHDRGAIAIAEALRTNTTLEELNLGCNKIGDAGVTAIADALRHNTGLSWLSLYANDYRLPGLRALGEGLKHNTRLKELLVGCNNFDDTCALTLADALETNYSLESVIVEQDEGSALHADALAHLQHVVARRPERCHAVLETFILGLRRLEGGGGVPLLDPALVDETLTYLPWFDPLAHHRQEQFVSI